MWDTGKEIYKFLSNFFVIAYATTRSLYCEIIIMSFIPVSFVIDNLLPADLILLLIYKALATLQIFLKVLE